jgi:hypothetical protein
VAAAGLRPWNGFTELAPRSHCERGWAGTHAHADADFEPGGCFPGALEARETAQFSAAAGAVLLRDLRLLHRAVPNSSPRPRHMLALVYHARAAWALTFGADCAAA